METTEQFVHDLRLLLKNKYPTRKAIVEVMAKGLNKNPKTFYANFIHYANGTKNISGHTLRGFYRIFQADLDAIKGGVVPSVDLFLQESQEDHIDVLKRNYDTLNHSMDLVIESNRILAATNKTLLETQAQLIAKLKELTEE